MLNKSTSLESQGLQDQMALLKRRAFARRHAKTLHTSLTRRAAPINRVAIYSADIIIWILCKNARAGDFGAFTRGASAPTGRLCCGTSRGMVLSMEDLEVHMVEIEFGKDTLDASRGILDDIAVLNTRYNIPKEQNNPLVVCLQLPNARQGYWQVVKDIKVVENIKINTISIGALLILLWNNKNLNLCTNPFYADFDNMSIKKCVEDILGRKIQLIDGSIGIFEPIK